MSLRNLLSWFSLVGPALAAGPSRNGRDNRNGLPTSGSPTRLLFCSALALLALGSATLAHAQLKVGDTFPAFAPAGVVTLTGAPAPATAGKIVLVDFWASWCTPCKASFPYLAKIHTDFAARGLLLAAVSIDEKPAAAAAFAKKLAPPFLTLHDREQKLVKEVVVPTMPTSYLLDRTGKIRFIHDGFHGDATDKLLREQIAALLAEK